MKEGQSSTGDKRKVQKVHGRGTDSKGARQRKQCGERYYGR